MLCITKVIQTKPGSRVTSASAAPMLCANKPKGTAAMPAAVTVPASSALAAVAALWSVRRLGARAPARGSARASARRISPANTMPANKP